MRSPFVLFVVLGIGIGVGYAAKAADAPADETSVASEHGTARHPTACSLVDRHEMSRILGGAVGPPAGDDRDGSTTCTYSAAGTGAFPYARVAIDWQGGEAAMAGIRLAESLMGKDAGFPIADRIDGVGDEASMMIGGLMSVRKGPTVITIDLRLQPLAKEKGIAIARAILARALHHM